MKNNFLTKAFYYMHINKIDAYLCKLAGENLYEFVGDIDNLIKPLTGFTGDTASLLLLKNKAILLIDGRFVAQAHKEIKDNRIKIEEINENNNLYDVINSLNSIKNIYINPKKISSNQYIKLKKNFNSHKIKLVNHNSFMKNELNDYYKNIFRLSSAPLYLLSDKYITENSISKIKNTLSKLFELVFDKNTIKRGFKNDLVYITSSLEEIAFITNLRYRFSEIGESGVLFKSFLIISNKKTYLYIRDYLEEGVEKVLNKNHIFVKDISLFYSDLDKYRGNNNVYFDGDINNYFIYSKLKLKNTNIISSPLKIYMSVKNKNEIKSLKKASVIDGIALVNMLYKIDLLKKNGSFKKGLYKEYDILKIVDAERKRVGRNDFLCPSFNTIVSYNQNAAICHYSPTKSNSKKVYDKGLLLIDSGGNYTYGTTDVTRTINLYSNLKDINPLIKKYYTLILNSIFELSEQTFMYGVTGTELDILARKYLYNEFFDFNHGTGHGVGYISNVHEGPNRIGPYINKYYESNIMEQGQLTTIEPGLYFENKFGIRLENNVLTYIAKENEYGQFMKFETLTLCPFENDFIDKKYLTEFSLLSLNKYHEKVYKKLSPFLTKDVKIWLKNKTKKIIR